MKLSPAETGIMGVWVGGTLITAALTGTLAPLVGAIMLAYGVHYWAKSSLTRRWTDARQQQMELLAAQVFQIRMNAEQARENYLTLKAALPKGAPKQQVLAVENARRAMFAMENNPAIADQIQAHMEEIKRSGTSEQMLANIGLSADLLAWGTFFLPAVPFLLVGAALLPKRSREQPQQWQWDWEKAAARQKLLPGG